MNQRYRRSTYRQPTTYSTSCCPPSYETFAHTLLPLSASNSAGLGLSPCSTTMAMPQTQSPEPIHGLHYFQRPLWDPVSTLMLEPNASGASMERERSWEEAYDPFAQLQFTGPPASEQLLLPTPVSQSSECQRFPETSSRIPSLSLPSSQAGSYSSSSYPPSDRFEDSASLFSHSRLKMEGSLDWPGNPESELPTSRASMEPSECFIAPGAVYDARRVLRRSPEEGHLPLYSEPMLRKQTRRGSLVKRASHVPNEEPKSKTYKRRRTPRENANWLCEICDMPFERPYNLKSHLETHDPHREKPFKCEYEGCAREFVRKTDLVRHIQSVHVKARDWVCSLCEQAFARKDTLRRHEEDGCSKRYDMKHREARHKSMSHSSTSSSPLHRGRSLTEEAAMQLSQLSVPSLVAHSPRRGNRH